MSWLAGLDMYRYDERMAIIKQLEVICGYSDLLLLGKSYCETTVGCLVRENPISTLNAIYLATAVYAEYFERTELHWERLMVDYSREHGHIIVVLCSRALTEI